eukprot:TRINITY_DN14318_c0_g1_i2.p1 TRINITY_DN14318_c0_g1~~TRINITY_DN14318_c0_g1_i2.p1  ORF type:complete len:399 (-),score=41.92 TRINITY_DN14318_c0_g1_i2:73-1140(-)
MDAYWMHNRTDIPDAVHSKRHTADEGELLFLSAQSLPANSYNYRAYLSYLLYIPLYLAGPIASFNLFQSQMEANTKTTEPDYRGFFTNVFRHGKVVAKLFFLTIVTNYVMTTSMAYYYQAGMNEAKLFKYRPMSLFQLEGLAVLNLFFMYLKFKCMWSAFRLWALLDGIQVYENMKKCIVVAGISFQGFWRAWHASLHEWVLRYLYGPLGGRKTQKLSIWVVFLFIGLWHDLKIRWVAWAVINILGMSFELVVRGLAEKFKVEDKLTKRIGPFATEWFFHLCSGINTVIVITAQLAIAHAFIDLRILWGQALAAEDSLKILALTLFTLSVAVPYYRWREVHMKKISDNSAKKLKQ